MPVLEFQDDRSSLPTTIAAPAPDPPPDFELIDTIEVVASGAGTGQLNGPITSALFGENGDGFSKRALNGTDLDEYIIRGVVNIVVNQTDTGIRINSDSDASDIFGIGVGGGDGQGASVISGQDIRMKVNDLFALLQPITTYFYANLWPEDGVQRAMLTFSGSRRDGLSAINEMDVTLTCGFYTDTAEVMDSIQIIANQTNGIGAGSYFRLYRLKGTLA